MLTKIYNVLIAHSEEADGVALERMLRDRLFQDERGRQLKIWRDEKGGLGDDGPLGHDTTFGALLDSECLVLALTPEFLLSDFFLSFKWQDSLEHMKWACLLTGPALSQLDPNQLPPAFRSLPKFDLEREWEPFIESLLRHCDLGIPVWMAPELPEGYVHRPSLFDSIRHLLLQPYLENEVHLTTAVTGPDGVGKTTLAAAICHDQQIRENFSDGILWATFNQGNELREVSRIYAALAGGHKPFKTLQDALLELSHILDEGGTRHLLVLDNLPRYHQFQFFLSPESSNVRVLLTGPGSVNLQFSMGWFEDRANTCKVGEMEEEEAYCLLARNWELNEHHRRLALQLCGHAGRWPLPLNVLRRLLLAGRRKGEPLSSVLGVLAERFAGLGETGPKLRSRETRVGAVAQFLQTAFGLLPPELRQKCLSLGNLPDGGGISARDVHSLWEVQDPEGNQTLRELDGLGLLAYNPAGAEVEVHPLLLWGYQHLVGNPKQMEGEAGTASKVKDLLDIWTDPYALPNEYAWRHYLPLLVKNNRGKEAEALLADFAWLKGKLSHTDVHSLLRDYALFSPLPRHLALLQQSLFLAAPALALDKKSLAFHLSQRLRSRLDHLPEAFRRALDTILREGVLCPVRTPVLPVGSPDATAHLLATATSLLVWQDVIVAGLDDGKVYGLNQADGQVVFYFSAHHSAIEAMVLWGDVLVTGSHDGFLRSWDLANRQEGVTFANDYLPVSSLAVSGDTLASGGGHLNCATQSWEGFIKIWDLPSGQLRHHIAGHNHYVKRLALCGSFLVSAALDDILKVWDPETGSALHTIEGGD